MLVCILHCTYEKHCCLDSVGSNGSINQYHIEGGGGGGERRILICLNNECNE